MAGTLADLVTEPAMQSSSGLSSAFGWFVGTGTGAGMALQYAISGAGWLVIILLACFIPTIWNVEDLLPDHEQLEKASRATAQPQETPAPGGIALEQAST
jgi:hypothetical protein